jgi:hypothetical protein
VKFLALIYGDQAHEQGWTPEKREAVIQKYIAFAREGRAAGKVLGGDELAPVTSATTVRVRDGETAVTDGPYAETKEALGGYFLLECDDIEEAVALAAKIPGAATGAVEVRPVHVDEEEATS